MTDRILKLLENGNYVARGFMRDKDGYFAAYQDENAQLDYTLDLSGWLGSETISSVSYEDKNLTRAISESTNTITFTISDVAADPAWTRARVTTSGGSVKDITLRFYEREM